MACVSCALGPAVSEAGGSEVVVLVSGDTSPLQDPALVASVQESGLPVYLVSYPATLHPSQPKLLPCGHTFCLHCLEKFVNPKLLVECPTCRKVPHSTRHFPPLISRRPS